MGFFDSETIEYYTYGFATFRINGEHDTLIKETLLFAIQNDLSIADVFLERAKHYKYRKKLADLAKFNTVQSEIGPYIAGRIDYRDSYQLTTEDLETTYKTIVKEVSEAPVIKHPKTTHRIINNLTDADTFSKEYFYKYQEVRELSKNLPNFFSRRMGFLPGDGDPYYPSLYPAQYTSSLYMDGAHANQILPGSVTESFNLTSSGPNPEYPATFYEHQTESQILPLITNKDVYFAPKATLRNDSFKIYEGHKRFYSDAASICLLRDSRGRPLTHYLPIPFQDFKEFWRIPGHRVKFINEKANYVNNYEIDFRIANYSYKSPALVGRFFNIFTYSYQYASYNGSAYFPTSVKKPIKLSARGSQLAKRDGQVYLQVRIPFLSKEAYAQFYQNGKKLDVNNPVYATTVDNPSPVEFLNLMYGSGHPVFDSLYARYAYSVDPRFALPALVIKYDKKYISESHYKKYYQSDILPGLKAFNITRDVAIEIVETPDYEQTLWGAFLCYAVDLARPGEDQLKYLIAYAESRGVIFTGLENSTEKQGYDGQYTVVRDELGLVKGGQIARHEYNVSQSYVDDNGDTYYSYVNSDLYTRVRATNELSVFPDRGSIFNLITAIGLVTKLTVKSSNFVKGTYHIERKFAPKRFIYEIGGYQNNDTVQGVKQVPPLGYLEITRQITDTEAIIYRFFDVSCTMEFAGGNSQETLLGKEVTEMKHTLSSEKYADQILFPLIPAVLDALPNYQATKIIEEALRYVVILEKYEKIKIKWYQKTSFTTFLKVVGLVAAVFTFGASAAAAASISALAADLAVQALVQVAVTFATKELLKLVSPDLALVIAAIAAVSLGVKSTLEAIRVKGIAGLPFADEAILAVGDIKLTVGDLAKQFSGTLVSSSQEYYLKNVQEDNEKLQERNAEFLEEYKERMEAIEEAQDSLDGYGISPHTLVSPFFSSSIHESSQDFFSRALNVNPGVSTIAAVSSYSNNILALPKDRNFIEHQFMAHQRSLYSMT